MSLFGGRATKHHLYVSESVLGLVQSISAVPTMLICGGGVRLVGQDRCGERLGVRVGRVVLVHRGVGHCVDGRGGHVGAGAAASEVRWRVCVVGEIVLDVHVLGRFEFIRGGAVS